MRGLRAWNDRLNGLPRKALLVVVTLFCCALLWWLLPYFLPFAVAFALSLLLNKPVSMAAGWLARVRLGRLRLGRGLATALCMALLFGAAGWALAALTGRLARETLALVKSAPQWIGEISQSVIPYAREWYEANRTLLPPQALQLVESAMGALSGWLVRLAGTLSAWLTSGAWSTATSIPSALLSVVLTVMGTYYFTADRERIRAFFARLMPQSAFRGARDVRRKLLGALMGQLRSQLWVSVIIIGFLAISFSAFGVRYGLACGVLIGAADALPVVGAGLALIPWSVVGFATGDTATGVFMACVYVGTVVLRQVVEPRIVGKSLGLYPLATMAAMYAGYRALGFAGLLAGPVMLHVLRAVLEADEAALHAKQ